MKLKMNKKIKSSRIDFIMKFHCDCVVALNEWSFDNNCMLRGEKLNECLPQNWSEQEKQVQ